MRTGNLLKRDGRIARGEASRQAILDGAVTLLATGGLSAVTHRAVANLAGVSPALTTYHFATLDDLLGATAVWVAASAAARLEAATDRVRDGSASLLDATTAFLILELGANRAAFIAKLELDIAAARRANWSGAGPSFQARFVELIEIFIPDRQAAEALFTAVLGFTVLHVMQGREADAQACRSFLSNLFAQYQLVEPDVARPSS